jgi:hypothetical protein
MRPGIQDVPQLIIGLESPFPLHSHFFDDPDKKVGIALLRAIDADNVTRGMPHDGAALPSDNQSDWPNVRWRHFIGRGITDW